MESSTADRNGDLCEQKEKRAVTILAWPDENRNKIARTRVLTFFLLTPSGTTSLITVERSVCATYSRYSQYSSRLVAIHLWKGSDDICGTP